MQRQFNKQKGIALIIFALILALVVTAYLISQLDGTSIKIEREKKTAAALAEAKAALIGYLISNSFPGTLLCSDTNNDGSADNISGVGCVANIGRLPWSDLGLAEPKDADGECLWYALSPIFNNQMSMANRILNPINSLTAGTITLLDNAGSALPASINPVIAVVVAPGLPVSGQSHSGVTTTFCTGNSIASNYLDNTGGINNATGNVVGNNYTFILGSLSNSFNDRFAYITANEVYPTLKKRIIKEILGNVAAPNGLVDYYNTNAVYPCPSATPTGNSIAPPCTPLSGYVPYNDTVLNLQYLSLGSWLTINGWFPRATYTYYTPVHVRVTITDAFGSNYCDANGNIYTCS